MSVYSGFVTRQQQHKYNSLLQTLIIALKKRIIKFYNNEQTDEDKFKLLVKKIYKKMYILEKGKFMTPKYTSCLSDLVQELSIEINYDTISQCSSIASNITFRKSIEQEQQLQSRNALKVKFSELEKIDREKRQNSALSVPRRNKFIRSALQNEEEQEKKGKKIPDSMYQTVEEKPGKKKKFKGAFIDLKELRGTSHMPKWQDFAPKRSQIFPISPHRKSPKNIDISHNIPIQNSHHITFRRQKYVKSDLKVQDL